MIFIITLSVLGLAVYLFAAGVMLTIASDTLDWGDEECIIAAIFWPCIATWGLIHLLAWHLTGRYLFRAGGWLVTTAEATPEFLTGLLGRIKDRKTKTEFPTAKVVRK